MNAEEMRHTVDHFIGYSAKEGSLALTIIADKQSEIDEYTNIAEEFKDEVGIIPNLEDVYTSEEKFTRPQIFTVVGTRGGRTTPIEVVNGTNFWYIGSEDKNDFDEDPKHQMINGVDVRPFFDEQLK